MHAQALAWQPPTVTPTGILPYRGARVVVLRVPGDPDAITPAVALRMFDQLFFYHLRRLRRTISEQWGAVRALAMVAAVKKRKPRRAAAQEITGLLAAQVVARAKAYADATVSRLPQWREGWACATLG
jgi:hypothetical protein